MSATIALNSNESGISPVCGWVVITEGDNKGRSYSVHSEKNSIGRGSQFDINLSFDNAISKDGDAVITYDSRGRKFLSLSQRGKTMFTTTGIFCLPPRRSRITTSSK